MSVLVAGKARHSIPFSAEVFRFFSLRSKVFGLYTFVHLILKGRTLFFLFFVF